MGATRGQIPHPPPASRDARIVELCDRAIDELNEARTIEDVRNIGSMAEAFAAYTRKIKAAIEAQNATHLVVLLSEARIGAELKAAQDRGEVATQGGDRKSIKVRSADFDPPGPEDLGIPRQRAAEMKKLAAAGEPAIRAEVARATCERRRPFARLAIGPLAHHPHARGGRWRPKIVRTSSGIVRDRPPRP